MRARHSNLYPVISQYHHHLPLIERTFHLAGLHSPPNDRSLHFNPFRIHYPVLLLQTLLHVNARSSITALGAGASLLYPAVDRSRQFLEPIRRQPDLDLGCCIWWVHSSRLRSGNWLSCSDGVGSPDKVVVDVIRPLLFWSKTPPTGTDWHPDCLSFAHKRLKLDTQLSYSILLPKVLKHDLELVLAAEQFERPSLPMPAKALTLSQPVKAWSPRSASETSCTPAILLMST